MKISKTFRKGYLLGLAQGRAETSAAMYTRNVEILNLLEQARDSVAYTKDQMMASYTLHQKEFNELATELDINLDDLIKVEVSTPEKKKGSWAWLR